MKTKIKLSHIAAPLLVVALTLPATLPPPARAQAMTPSANTHMVAPRYSYISQIASSLKISSSGYAACTGSYGMYKGMSGTITITLQQSDGGGWTTYKEESKDYSGDGAKIFDTGWDVAAGYRYRVTTTVEIKDANGDVVETATCDSPIRSY